MPVTHHASAGILSDQHAAKREEIIELLTTAYWMEIETVTNYLQQSINLDGIRAKEVAADLAEDVGEELGHAKEFAARIKELYGQVPGSADFPAGPEADSGLQPNDDTTDVVSVIKGVIAAESGAISHYTRIIEATDGVDWATQDMVIRILRDEEGHMRTYEGYLREYA
jgi:bacterioferritin